ncbi:MAG: hypothetical protein AB7I33_07805 [Gemmatimonadales bacterium]
MVVVSGVGGETRYQARFREEARRLVESARTRYGLPASRVHWLSEEPVIDPGAVEGRSSKENLTRLLGLLAQSSPAEQLMVVFIGHGSAQGGEARFNMPGPDITPAEMGGLLDRFTGPVVFVNLASASGAFLAPLSRPGRVVITSTRSGFERNEVQFGGFFIEALSGDGADTDKDGRISVLEAFTYAAHETRRFYETGQMLLTEHAMLDDNGDGRGSADPGATAVDGALAATLFLAPRGAATMARGQDPELDSLYRRKAEIEREIAGLRASRSQTERQVYENKLETLVVELAQVDRQIKAREGARQ